jgi:cysteinyl-tRNA synthetase
MAAKYLGAAFDIHTGGIDHREIHHPNEIAQNQAHCGCADTGATFWLHNNFLVDRTGKMSKSSGEFLTLSRLVERGFHPLYYRLMCLQAHYRSELEFSWENLAAAQVRFKRWVYAVEALRARAAGAGTKITAYTDQLDAALSDDLATPRALPVLDALLSDKKALAADRLATLAAFDDVLGLDLARLDRGVLRVRPIDANIDEPAIEARLEERKAARAAKEFARSDSIRDELVAAGVEVMDGDPLGWDWKLPS